MLPLRIDVFRNDSSAVTRRQLNWLRLKGRLLIEYRPKFGFGNNLLKQRVLCAIEVGSFFCFRHVRQIQWPDTNLGDLKRVENIHRHRVSSLIG